MMMPGKHPHVEQLAHQMREAAARISDPTQPVSTTTHAGGGVATSRHELKTWSETLRQVRQVRGEVDEQLRQIELAAAQEAFRLGARWGDIAQATGVTRQTTQATYRERENKPHHPPRRPEPQPLPKQARRPSGRDTNSWAAVTDDED